MTDMPRDKVSIYGCAWMIPTWLYPIHFRNSIKVSNFKFECLLLHTITGISLEFCMPFSDNSNKL